MWECCRAEGMFDQRNKFLQRSLQSLFLKTTAHIHQILPNNLPHDTKSSWIHCLVLSIRSVCAVFLLFALMASGPLGESQLSCHDWLSVCTGNCVWHRAWLNLVIVRSKYKPQSRTIFYLFIKNQKWNWIFLKITSFYSFSPFSGFCLRCCLDLDPYPVSSVLWLQTLPPWLLLSPMFYFLPGRASCFQHFLEPEPGSQVWIRPFGHSPSFAASVFCSLLQPLYLKCLGYSNYSTLL